jgi:hypothetical protein
MKLVTTLVTTAAAVVPATAAAVVVALAPFPGSAVDPVTTVTRHDDRDRREHEAHRERTGHRSADRTHTPGDDHGGRRDRDHRTEPGDDHGGRHGGHDD